MKCRFTDDAMGLKNATYSTYQCSDDVRIEGALCCARSVACLISCVERRVHGTDQRHAPFRGFHSAMEVASPDANLDICIQRQNYESLLTVLNASAKRT